jgi:GT2 family glycosyltransferase
VITPAHNEEKNLDALGKSLMAQTLMPALWVIVDDESSDGTFTAARKLAERRQWISVIRREKEPGVYDASFRAFEFGARTIRSAYDYIMKLDADTTLPSDFLERLVGKFQAVSSLGIGSGVCAGEKGIAHHPRGNNRMYRRECWDQIRFPEDGWGWDTIDQAFARLNGWKTAAFNDLACEHMRPRLRDAGYRFHQGRLSRHLGYYWWFALGRSAKMVASLQPVPALAYLAGYLKGGLPGADEDVKRAIKTDQRDRLASILGAGERRPVQRRVYAPRLDGTDPVVSIAMPTLNQARHLHRILDALHGCRYPRDRIRLIFVDGYSTDGSYQILQSFSRQHRAEYADIVLIQDRGNIPAARNLCIHIGRGDFLLFLDSDILPTPDFVGRLIGLAEVGGIASLFYSNFGYQHPKPAVKYVYTVGIGCTIIRKDVLDKVGLFDTTLPVGEDTDYCLRARKLGYDIVQDTTVRLVHFDGGRYRPERTIQHSLKYRRVYAKIFRLGIYRKRLALYVALDLATALGILVHPVFLLATGGYFAAQLSRRGSLKLASYLTLNSLIIAPLALVGLLERKLAPAIDERRA